MSLRLRFSLLLSYFFFLFFFNDPATTEIYTLSLHDALPISCNWRPLLEFEDSTTVDPISSVRLPPQICGGKRSEEHTSELQSQFHLVCRLLLEKKKKKKISCHIKITYHNTSNNSLHSIISIF